MTRHLYTLTDFYQARKESSGLFLVRVLKTEGTTFRKKGACMFCDVDAMDYRGLISGGCFEKDVLQHCAEMASHENVRIVTYDLGSEEDLFFGTGVGCPGSVTILCERVKGTLREILDFATSDDSCTPRNWITEVDVEALSTTHRLVDTKIPESPSNLSIIEEITDKRKLVIVGAGDLVKALSDLCGFMSLPHEIWSPSELEVDLFPKADRVVQIDEQQFHFPERLNLRKTDFALLSHNMHLDCFLLTKLKTTQVPYIGVMGAKVRLDHIRNNIGHSTWTNLSAKLFAPIGDKELGSEPEQIAFSIVAQLLKFRQNHTRHMQSPTVDLSTQMAKKNESELL